MAILGGAFFGASAYTLIPALSPRLRALRLLAGARRDLRRIVRGTWRLSAQSWEVRQYARLVGLPADAPLLDHARLLAALSAGRELLRQKTPDRLRQEASALELAEARASHPAFLDML